MDRWAARYQRKSDERQAHWAELAHYYGMFSAGLVPGPDGIDADICVDQTGLRWLHWYNHRSSAGSWAGGVVAALLLISTLMSETVWWLVFHRTYTIHVTTYGNSPVKLARISVRLPEKTAAYRAAADLACRFEDEGSAALDAWRAEVSASTP